MILVIDNYDSFTYNLVQALGSQGQELVVRRNDEIDVEDVAAAAPRAIVLSPGPGVPAEAGCCVEVIRRLGGSTPILGVCLGHQAIALAHGADVVRAPEVVHGKTAEVSHEGDALFAGLSSPFQAARYHSLVVDAASLPGDLEVTARAGEIVMAMRHAAHPTFGVQFHPESIATPDGDRLLSNFVDLARGWGGSGQ